MKLAKDYIRQRFPVGFFPLFSARSIVFLAGGLFGVFLPIFFYELLDRNFYYVALFYIVCHIAYIVALPATTQVLNHTSFRRALQVSVVFHVLFYLTLYFSPNNSVLYTLGLLLVIWTLFRVTYWIPYHVDFAKFTDAHDRGKQLSLLLAIASIVSALMPLVSGYLIEHYGFSPVFLIGIFFIALSAIPLLFLPKTEERYSWKYFETWKNLFSRKNRRILTAFGANGAEVAVGIAVWPIFIFELLDGNFFEVGAISAAIVVITVLTQLLTGRHLDRANKAKVLKWGTGLYALGWLLKIFIITAFQIFVVGAFHSLTRIFSQTTFDVLAYESAADQGHYVDEFTVMREMSIHIGRALMFVLAIILFAFLPIQWTFVLAALASVALNLLGGGYKRHLS